METQIHATTIGKQLWLIMTVFTIFQAFDARAATITVGFSGADFTTIGEALQVADDGDVIEIYSGVYTESLSTEKTLTIRGVGSVELSGSGEHKVLSLWRGADVVLQDLTFADGYAPDAGGAIDVRFSSQARIYNCTFIRNHADYQGGAIHLRHSGTRVEVADCVFVANSSDYVGGAITAILESELEVSGCTFTENDGDRVAAISVNEATAHVTNSLFSFNSSDDTIWFLDSFGSVSGCTLARNDNRRASLHIMNSTVAVERSIVYHNRLGLGLRVRHAPGPREYNIYWGNVGGDVYETEPTSTELITDPLFCNPANGDFSLALESPAAPSGNARGELIGALPVACSGPVPVTPSSFSRIKAQF